MFGGTFGAVLVSFTLDEVQFAVTRLKTVFISEEPAPDRLVRTIVMLATKARQNGIIMLENETEKLTDPFLKKGLMLAVDGNSLKAVRELLEVEDEAILLSRIDGRRGVRVGGRLRANPGDSRCRFWG